MAGVDAALERHLLRFSPRVPVEDLMEIAKCAIACGRAGDWNSDIEIPWVGRTMSVRSVVETLRLERFVRVRGV